MGNLLAQLISKNVVFVKAANEEGKNYEETFRHVHDSIESGFITATDALSNEWISSPAGELWLSELTKAR
jgi:ribosomal protein S11